MIELFNLNESKNIMENLDVIIYGTIRDIEDHFLKSFTNIDLLCNYFNNVFIIIFENDSLDNTRNILKEWSLKNNNNKIKKHIILEDNLNSKYPLRAHRLAYCRNVILNYIFTNHLNNNYQYAIHCDLDDRFWSLNFDSICNCFQYDLNKWDAMFPVNNNGYYDFWALRCNDCWFNKNIFSCEANYSETNKEYTKHLQDLFIFLNNNENNLIKVQSAFNALGIYKLNSMKDCYYNADYLCNICNGNKEGCLEDNDHIGLHNKMISKNCNLFINKNMIITCKGYNYINFSTFINKLHNVKNIDKSLLKYVLYNNLIDNNYFWLNFSNNFENYDNIISKNCNNNIFSFQINETNNYPEKNIYKNVIKYVGNITKNINDFISNNINNNSLISFIHIDFNNYHNTRIIFEKLYNKINDNCIIVFNKFVNFPYYLLHDLHAFYKFTQIYNITFEYIGINGVFNINPTDDNNNNNNNNTEIAIKIINNPNIYKSDILKKNDYNIFDWEKYINSYDDLKNIKNKEEAWDHWINHGKNEERNYFSINKFNNFDWEKYISSYDDLKNIKNKEEAWDHWINHGKNEERNYFLI